MVHVIALQVVKSRVAKWGAFARSCFYISPKERLLVTFVDITQILTPTWGLKNVKACIQKVPRNVP